jgi:dipeptidyl aminopeptidase/acylaminoacyl peptidase
MNKNKSADTIGLDEYKKAESFLPWNVFGKALNVRIQPNWIHLTHSKSCQFWYLSQTRSGKEFILVDVEHKTRKPVFDHSKLATALSEKTGRLYEKYNLPFDTIEFLEDGDSILIEVDDHLWRYDLGNNQIEKIKSRIKNKPEELLSPNLKLAIYTKQNNLWVRPLPAGEEFPLTDDGEFLDDYASRSDTNGIAVLKKMMGEFLPPVALWSPDSKKLLTHKLNQKEVKEIVLVQSVPTDGSVRPQSYSYHYPLPGDERVGLSELVILDVEKRTRVKIQYKPQRVPFMYTTIESRRAWWSEDGSKIYFLFTEPGDKVLRLCEADAQTGQTRVLVEEVTSTHIDVNLNIADLPNFRVVKNGDYVIWFSERNGWGHLYLYDGKSGQFIKQITQGAWVVREILYVDEDQEVIYFTAGGREINPDPYYRFLYRISFFGDNLTLLTPEDGDHNITFSPTGKYFLDTYSRVDTIPTSLIRNYEGKYLFFLEYADIGQILGMGWKKPERFCVKARDGITDIYGLLYYPSTFNPSRKYPILDDVYPGPQSIRTIKAFPQDPLSAIDFWGPQAISELGFLVVTMDGLGTPLRSKAFHDFSYGNLGDGGGLEDHIAGIRQLASSRAYMDLERVGIYGHSGGGFASARALLRFPDFFKVAVSSAGNHDQRGFLAGWGEKYQGLLDGENYRNQVNADLAKYMKGKLLLIFGDMDLGVHPALTIQLIDALVKANKDFDLLILPNRDHFYMNDPYFIRKTWDYFVQHLIGQSPPLSYKIQEPDPVFAKAVYQ